MKKIKLALELIDFALSHEADYILILQDLEEILKGKRHDFNEEDYL